MEIRARYTLIGLFTLAAFCAGFAFVYWLDTAGGLTRRAQYQIAFDGPVAGLLRGSPVLFNGIRVGEVTALALDPARPKTVTVSIGIETLAPVRADTKVGIEFQGLTGAPVVALVGGIDGAPLLAKSAGRLPLLVAETNAGQGMTEGAREVLRHIDAVVVENATPLKTLIDNIEKFSGALARNSDRVDNIVAGLERMTGGSGKPSPQIYELSAPTTFPALARIPAGQLLLPDPTSLAIFETERVLVRAAEGDSPVLERAQWPDTLPKLVRARLIESFEHAGYTKVMGRVSDVPQADYQLLVDIRSFHVVPVNGGGEALVEIAARLVDPQGRIVDARTFRHTAPVAVIEAGPATSSLNKAFGEVATALVLWACAAVPAAP